MAKTVKSAGKVMATIFLGCTRNHLHRLFGKGKNDNRRVLCVVIGPVERRNQGKTSSFETEKILFYQENARVHTCAVAMAKIMELKFKLLQHSQYSRDLATSDFFLFL